ncbi:MAG: hypothetical protein Q7K42_01180 [Candidatus Diapherotrites archaeon]|nr:hypothetical protein [Candidatus Diapherotrites archaeon]
MFTKIWKKFTQSLFYTAVIYGIYLVFTLTGARPVFEAFALTNFLASFLFVFTSNWLFA